MSSVHRTNGARGTHPVLSPATTPVDSTPAPAAGTDATRGVDPRRAAGPDGSGRHRRPVSLRLFGVGVVAIAIGYLVVTGLSTSAVYYLTVGEFYEQQAQGAISPDGRPVRVSGDVVPGSIVREGALLRFEIADAGASLPVTYRGVIPDIFGEGIQVVVEGRPSAGGSFQARTLLAKCPSKFEAATHTGVMTAVVPSRDALSTGVPAHPTRQAQQTTQAGLAV